MLLISRKWSVVLVTFQCIRETADRVTTSLICPPECYWPGSRQYIAEIQARRWPQILVEVDFRFCYVQSCMYVRCGYPVDSTDHYIRWWFLPALLRGIVRSAVRRVHRVSLYGVRSETGRKFQL